MLLYFKPLREIDRAIGKAVGWALNKAFPKHSDIREIAKLDREQNLNASDNFRTHAPYAYEKLGEASSELNEDVPIIEFRNLDYTAISSRGRIYMSYLAASKIPLEQTKAAFTHELGHLDTNIVGTLCYKIASRCLAISTAAIFIHNSTFTQTLLAASATLTVLAGAYSRSEEFRCDETTLRNNTSNDFIAYLRTQQELNITKEPYYDRPVELIILITNLLHSILEPLNNYPTDWARKENLRRAEAEKKSLALP